ncbi:glycosyltransferase [Planktothrix pseudagardhii]|uniref:GDP-mannose-dependent alpha-(1-6)-phosphatidylinositol monomannoside mannosyltransferase n=1 Tax=Planktothrix pseudagardhii TaxID=132604 RepID=A0A9W4GBI8_9CYAN|nr:glycosyltransferase [Planktothrix pseudagardhii]CAD5983401.1 GDP-mannose-dependent alpha-(1-6)-phosphatidylinositol monomannoside mannosyltransferase [Planktothrix pseudagardhii]
MLLQKHPKLGQTHSRLTWCFLAVFSCEGGIQSYVKDILTAYQDFYQLYEPSKQPINPESYVLILRDSPESFNPLETPSSLFKFQYFKSQFPTWGRLQLAKALLLDLLQERPERVLCGHINLSHLVQTICQPLGIPYTVLTYGKEVWEPLPQKYQNALQNADQIWTISRYSRDQACLANHLNPKQFEMLPCMVNGEHFTPGPKPQHLIERYGLQDARVLMTVARLWKGDPYKGVDVTIRALSQIAQVFPDVKYLVIGRGDDQPRLQQLAQDLGVSDRVVFAGFVPTEELVDHYRVCDGYVMPSQEGFGIVYLEAMACEKPVIAGDSDGSADPLQDGKLGWQVPHRDVDAVAQACIELLKGEDQRCNGPWLRQQSLASFGKPAFQNRVQQLLQQKVVLL